jgi:short-subunit dehydrogenase
MGIDWSDSVVVMTGASRGIGWAVAEAAARKGPRIGLIARAKDDLEAVLASIVDPGIVDTEFFETRGHRVDTPFPKPISAERVAEATIRAVERGRAETFVPGWFKAAVAVRHLAPSLFQRGTRRRFRRVAR